MNVEKEYEGILQELEAAELLESKELQEPQALTVSTGGIMSIICC